MMSITAAAPWHKESFDKFINERLPQLLADRLPLGGYFVAIVCKLVAIVLI